MDYEQTSLVYRNLGHEKKFQEPVLYQLRKNNPSEIVNCATHYYR